MYSLEIEKAHGGHDFRSIDHLSGVKVIHISKRYTRMEPKSERVKEFVDSSSLDGLHTECTAPAEMGWGTRQQLQTKYDCAHPWPSPMAVGVWVYS